MKTTDLIPIILYQLVDGDKYGYEIVKQIEDRSNGGIVIKQPTLYSVLKKLEQGRFISSYWQDSEIGGKRHYYKLTESGKVQLDTYPTLDKLIKDALEEDGVILSPAPRVDDDTTMVEPHTTSSELNNEVDDINEIKPIHIDLTLNQNESIQQPIDNVDGENTPPQDNQEENTLVCREDNIEQNNNIEPLNNGEEVQSSDVTMNETEQDLPGVNPSNIVEVIAEGDTPSKYASIFDAIDFDTPQSYPEINKSTIDELNVSELNEINIENTLDTQEEQILQEEKPIFTEKVDSIAEPYVANKLYDQLTPNDEIATTTTLEETELSSPTSTLEEVKYLNYVDLSLDKSSIKRKKAIKLHISKMIFTCLSLLIVLILNTVLCYKYSFGRLYYIFTIITCLIIILYPIILFTNIPKIRFKYCSKPFKYSLSRDLFIKLSLFLSLIISILAYNISCTTTIAEIFSISNCANFLCPILFSGVIILDFVYSVICYKNYR